MTCNVCESDLGEPLYVSERSMSLTSLCELREGITRVTFCSTCGHLQTAELASLQNYYDDDYKILLDSEDEDQLYSIANGEILYRNEHQMRTLLAKHQLPPAARVLDYGCAKGAALRRLLELQSHVDGYLFDISPMYLPFWQQFLQPQRYAMGQTPPAWDGSFDLIMSFFALEHIATLGTCLTHIQQLLKPGGLFYAIVPNVYANICDFVVSDHVNHFSAASLSYLLHRYGLMPVEIDESAHESAFVITARRSAEPGCPRPLDTTATAEQRRRVEQMARFWQAASRDITDFERQRQAGRRAAIYGSGFYGSFIASCLERLDRIDCFLDLNPYRQGKHLFGKPIIAPQRLRPHCQPIYVGLNPRIARSSIASLDDWSDRSHDYFFFDGAAAG